MLAVGRGLAAHRKRSVNEHRPHVARGDEFERRRGMLEYALPKRVGEMAGETSGWGVHVPDERSLEIIRTSA